MKELSFTEGLKEGDEIAELEAEEAAKPVEDMTGYLKDMSAEE